MAELVQELATHAAAELGLAVNTDLFYGHFPETDTDPAAAFIATGGPGDRDDSAWLDRTVQVMVKGSYADALALAGAIYDLYHGTSNWQLPNWHIHYSGALQPPSALGRQEKNREAFSFNLLFSVRER